MSKTYGRPALTVHGKLEALTHGNAGGDKLDATYPVDTPKSQLTFS